jgi:hypothetical protein
MEMGVGNVREGGKVKAKVLKSGKAGREAGFIELGLGKLCWNV